MPILLKSFYKAGDWIFTKPLVVDIPRNGPELIGKKDFEGKDYPEDTDIVLIKTWFENFRDKEHYWRNGPVLSDNHLCNLVSLAVPVMRENILCRKHFIDTSISINYYPHPTKEAIFSMHGSESLFKRIFYSANISGTEFI